MNNKIDLASSIVKTISSDQILSDTVGAMDQWFGHDAAKVLMSGLPLVKDLLAMGKVCLSVRDHLFMRKLIAFLQNIRDVSERDRQVMIRRIERESGYRRRVGEYLIEVLERVDAYRKPEMMAKVFVCYSRKDIDYNMLVRLIDSVERLRGYEIDNVRKLCCDISVERILENVDSYQSIQMAGLMNVFSGYGGLTYKINQVGQAFLDLELDKVDVSVL